MPVWFKSPAEYVGSAVRVGGFLSFGPSHGPAVKPPWSRFLISCFYCFFALVRARLVRLGVVVKEASLVYHPEHLQADEAYGPSIYKFGCFFYRGRGRAGVPSYPWYELLGLDAVRVDRASARQRSPSN